MSNVTLIILNSFFRHGDNCAGIIAAVLNNSFCGVGLAFKASIGGKYWKVVIIMLHTYLKSFHCTSLCRRLALWNYKGSGLEIRLSTLSVLKQAIQTHISNMAWLIVQT